MIKLQTLVNESWQFFLVFLIISVVLVITQRQQIYYPRVYNTADKKIIKFTQPIHYNIGNDKQTAYLYPAKKEPENVWILVGGNASLALQWLYLLQHIDLPNTSFLLVDYPGYGLNQGYPNEKDNTTAIKEAYLAMTKELKISPNIFLLGHSLGSAVAVNAARQIKPKALVLLSPFTSIYDMAKRSITTPWAWLLKDFIWDKYESDKKLSKLAKTNPEMQVYILHGNKDNIVPVSMGRILANKNKGWVKYKELNGIGHQVPFDAQQAVIKLITTITENSK